MSNFFNPIEPTYQPYIWMDDELGANPFFDYQSVFGTPNNVSTPSFNPNLNPATWGSSSSSGGSSSGSSTLENIGSKVSNQLKFDQIIALISQGIGAWGKNPTTQVSGFGVKTVAPQQQAVNPNYGGAGVTMTAEQVALYQATLNARNNTNSAGGALGSGLDGIVGWATQNPLIVFGGIAAVFLLMKEPPRGRR